MTIIDFFRKPTRESISEFGRGLFDRIGKSVMNYVTGTEKTTPKHTCTDLGISKTSSTPNLEKVEEIKREIETKVIQFSEVLYKTHPNLEPNEIVEKLIKTEEDCDEILYEFRSELRELNARLYAVSCGREVYSYKNSIEEQINLRRDEKSLELLENILDRSTDSDNEISNEVLQKTWHFANYLDASSQKIAKKLSASNKRGGLETYLESFYNDPECGEIIDEIDSFKKYISNQGYCVNENSILELLNSTITVAQEEEKGREYARTFITRSEASSSKINLISYEFAKQLQDCVNKIVTKQTYKSQNGRAIEKNRLEKIINKEMNGEALTSSISPEINDIVEKIREYETCVKKLCKDSNTEIDIKMITSTVAHSYEIGISNIEKYMRNIESSIEYITQMKRSMPNENLFINWVKREYFKPVEHRYSDSELNREIGELSNNIRGYVEESNSDPNVVFDAVHELYKTSLRRK